MEKLVGCTLDFYNDGKRARVTKGKVIYCDPCSNVYVVEMTIWGYDDETQKPSRHIFNMEGNRLEGYQTYYLDKEGNYQKLPVIEWACSEEIINEQ